MLDRCFQIVLDEYRYQKVAREAHRRGTSIDEVINQAIDQLALEPESRRNAIAAVLAAEPMAVPDDPAELRREIERTRAGIDP